MMKKMKTPLIVHQPHSRHETYPKCLPEDIAHDPQARSAWFCASPITQAHKRKGGKQATLYYGRTISDWAEELNLSISYVNELKKSGKLGHYLAAKGYPV